MEVLKNALFAATEATHNDNSNKDAPPPIGDVQISMEDNRRKMCVVNFDTSLP